MLTFFPGCITYPEVCVCVFGCWRRDCRVTTGGKVGYLAAFRLPDTRSKRYPASVELT